jgi:hypothetical protein
MKETTMTTEPKRRPKWVEELLEEGKKPLRPDLLKQRQEALDWIREHRMDIRPETVSDYILAIREDEDEDDV